MTTRYLRGDAIDQLFARMDGSGVGGWYLTDRQSSVRQITDTSGTVQNTITYDGFGQIVSESNSSYNDRYKYTSREYDSEIHLQYNRARYYDASVGRWLSQDPIGFSAGDSNLYRYVNNSPTMATDPSGLELFAYDESVAKDFKQWIEGKGGFLEEVWGKPERTFHKLSLHYVKETDRFVFLYSGQNELDEVIAATTKTPAKYLLEALRSETSHYQMKWSYSWRMFSDVWDGDREQWYRFTYDHTAPKYYERLYINANWSRKIYSEELPIFDEDVGSPTAYGIRKAYGGSQAVSKDPFDLDEMSRSFGGADKASLYTMLGVYSPEQAASDAKRRKIAMDDAYYRAEGVAGLGLRVGETAIGVLTSEFIVGVPIAAKGADGAFANLWQIYTGQRTNTMTANSFGRNRSTS